MSTNSTNSTADADRLIAEGGWKSYYSWAELDFASEYAARMTEEFGVYLTAIRVTPELVTCSQIVGEWMITSKYDPRLVASK